MIEHLLITEVDPQMSGTSVRRRLIYSLAVVRLILAPVILLAVYYLFRMGWIVDRIVNVDAPAATLAEQASVEMLTARHAERDFFLLRDPASAEATRKSTTKVIESMREIEGLQPQDSPTIRNALEILNEYRQSFDAAAQSEITQPSATARLRDALNAYEQDLNGTLKKGRRSISAGLIEELNHRVASFEEQVLATMRSSDPEAGAAETTLEVLGTSVVRIASGLEKSNWDRVQSDHAEARALLRRSEWVLSILSGLTIVLSVWISVVLPRAVLRPLNQLKEWVDRVASGDYKLEIAVRGDDEVERLAGSVRNLISRFRQRT